MLCIYNPNTRTKDKISGSCWASFLAYLVTPYYNIERTCLKKKKERAGFWVRHLLYKWGLPRAHVNLVWYSSSVILLHLQQGGRQRQESAPKSPAHRGEQLTDPTPNKAQGENRHLRWSSDLQAYDGGMNIHT